MNTTHWKAGLQVYPNWRIDKNISWWNVNNYWMGLIHGLITLEWLSKKSRYMLWRFKLGKLWLPPHYSKDYKTYNHKKEINKF